VEIELSSYLQDDDAIGNFIGTYMERFETHARLIELDGILVFNRW